MITKYWILKNIYFNKAIKQSHYVSILIPITFLQLEFQKSTLWTLCNITHKISSNILERMGPPLTKYLRGHYFNFECFLLHNTYNHLQWPQMISLWHRNPKQFIQFLFSRKSHPMQPCMHKIPLTNKTTHSLVIELNKSQIDQTQQPPFYSCYISHTFIKFALTTFLVTFVLNVEELKEPHED